MVLYLASSKYQMATTDMVIENARHLLAILLRHGRPACPAEITSRCVVFSDVPTDLVELLCRIPNSPLLLTDGSFVTVSEVAVASFVEIMSRDIAQFLPRITISVRDSTRKRMCPILLPSAKRIHLLRSGDEEMEADEDTQAPLALVNRTDNGFFAEGLPIAGASGSNQEISSRPDGTVFKVGDFPICRITVVKEQTMDGLYSTAEFPVVSEESHKNKDNRSIKQHNEIERGGNSILTKKIKRSRNQKLPSKENRANVASKTIKNQTESKKLPDFKSFIIEEEEGSGGYGTVYRAHRKTDGKTFAVKCPHPSANLHHVSNELKMLERYGGRNFVIKFEGSFKSGNSDCLILEHVEHDRPEVLKREINVFELQWYGYCMFKALTSLHKQGIVHRDVKPGNFLFSRKLNKGYLIDFNLAMDLHYKQRSNCKSGPNSSGIINDASLPQIKPTCRIPVRKVALNRPVKSFSKEAAKDSKMPHVSKIVSKNIKKKVEKSDCNAPLDFENRNKYRSQAADGSGITSTKDPMSTRTPSVDRLREPIPCRGRKELINLAQEVMQNPNQKAVTIPAIQRKRVAAPTEGDMRLAVVTPMPLHHNGVAISVAGPIRNKGDGKYKREGPCVGTKGFRAPEVLFKSPHQGCKVDVWSAGVTLLYLMIGRTPFGGEPELNVKEIAKLRGSEDLWEVAKLHNRESSFPVELFDVSSLQSIKLTDWCKMNTRRPEFLDFFPSCLIDLVDKCLTVNPRLRISAEEALMHEFFAPCHESLRKHRMLRQVLASATES